MKAFDEVYPKEEEEADDDVVLEGAKVCAVVDITLEMMSGDGDSTVVIPRGTWGTVIEYPIDGIEMSHPYLIEWIEDPEEDTTSEWYCKREWFKRND